MNYKCVLVAEFACHSSKSHIQHDACCLFNRSKNLCENNDRYELHSSFSFLFAVTVLCFYYLEMRRQTRVYPCKIIFISLILFW